MENFELNKAKAILKRVVTATRKSKDGNEQLLYNDVSFSVHVDQRCRRAVELLFPGHEAIETAMAARGGNHAGVVLQTAGDLPDINVEVFDGTGRKSIFRFERIGLLGRPKLLVNSIGDSTIMLRLNAKMTKRDMGELVDYVSADVYLDSGIAQMGLPGVTSKAIEALQPLTTTPALEQQDLATMTGTELLEARNALNMTRTEFSEWLEANGHPVATKSLMRYELGRRPVPETISDIVKRASPAANGAMHG